MSATIKAMAFVQALNALSHCRFDSEDFHSISRTQELLFMRFLNNTLSGNQMSLEVLGKIEEKAKESFPPDKFSYNHYHVSSAIQAIINAALTNRSGELKSKIKSSTYHIAFDAVMSLSSLLGEGGFKSPAKATMYFTQILSKLQDRDELLHSHRMSEFHNDLYTLINHTDGFRECEVINLNELLRDTFESRLWVKES